VLPPQRRLRRITIATDSTEQGCREPQDSMRSPRPVHP